MKVKFNVTADLDTGELTIVCPNVFKFIDNGWGSGLSTNYSDVYRQKICTRKLLSSPTIRSNFMNLAKLTEQELKKVEAFREDK